MRILGLSAFYHDSAAALVVDGKIVAAAQEERFSREKHDQRFPHGAIASCLELGGVSLEDVDFVAFYDKPLLKFERLLETYLAFAPQGRRSFVTAVPVWLKEKLFQERVLRDELRRFSPGFESQGRLLFAEHHLSHAASAFFPSPFAEAAVLSIDGVGEWTTTSVAIGCGNHLEIVREIHFPHSIGLLYSAFTYYLGFEVNGGEYKVMGLAPYGEPVFAHLILDHLLDLKPDGTFRLDQAYFDYCTSLRMTNERFDALFGGPRREPDQLLTQRHMDIAASIQAVLEEVVLLLTRAVARDTGMENLCLAGGVALNCVANGKVARDGAFKNIWIQPAAGDAGGAIGAALTAYHCHLGEPRADPGSRDGMSGAYLGPAYDEDRIHGDLDRFGAAYRDLDTDALFDEVVTALVDEKVVGWFQGRMEFGPRALGNRSILADPRSPKVQLMLNLKVKYRESFRPFAPAVLRADVASWFDLDGDSPYMLLVADVAAQHRRVMTAEEQALFGIEKLNVVRSSIPAVTHIDYSARVQTVHEDSNPPFHRLLSEMKARTGVGVLVNTSFNVRDEPIVCTPEDAYRCFMATEIDMLVIGQTVLLKSDQRPVPAATQDITEDGLLPPALVDCLTAPGSPDLALSRGEGGFVCPETGTVYPDKDDVPSLLAEDTDEITGRVKRFYEQNPFPNYADIDDFATLVTRGRRNPLTRALGEAIGYNKLVLECGCGTGQLSHFLSLGNNHVLGIDLSQASLALALRHKLRYGLHRVGFVQMNILDLAIRDASFDVVISMGALHHTRDAKGAFSSLVRKVKPGGVVVVGLYNRYARIPTALRSMLIGKLGHNIDYVVRTRTRDDRKADIWIKDQYFNPHETWHSIDETLGWFRDNGVSYLNCQPQIAGAECADAGLFAPHSPGSRVARVATQLSWLATIAREGSLFVMIGRRE